MWETLVKFTGGAVPPKQQAPVAYELSVEQVVKQYDRLRDRPHPQVTWKETKFEPESFFGKVRSLYSDAVLKAQLEQFRQQGTYTAFDLKYQKKYDRGKLEGGMFGASVEIGGWPETLFWESDIAKWIEAVCYFLGSSGGHASPHAKEFETEVARLINLIEKAQQPDGYLNIYFTVVDKKGKYKNFRDLHEMYNSGHLLEAALAHYHTTGSRQFLNVMIKNIASWMKVLGWGKDQLKGYPGHPELELAMLRLYDVTRDPDHLHFGYYLLAARGQKRAEQGNESYFVWEAEQRGDKWLPGTMANKKDMTYNQSHAPLHEQDAILGHSVRAMYLITAAADLGGEYLNDAKRLLDDAVNHKMYVTGGFGTEPRTEGFSTINYRLPQSSDEGGCYAETCASIGAMMVCERILSYQLDDRYRDILELSLYNAVLGGGSLDGKAFAYVNFLATSGHETAFRSDWFSCCCCPPNLARTLGLIGGYTWNGRVHGSTKTIELDIYLLLGASRTFTLPGDEKATVKMDSGMPWNGDVQLDLRAPAGWTWQIRLPVADYARSPKVSVPSTNQVEGFLSIQAQATSQIEYTFDMPVRLLAPHVRTAQDTLTVTRGPLVYAVESADNAAVDERYPHFLGLGLDARAEFNEDYIDIEGFRVITLKTKHAKVLDQRSDHRLYREADPVSPVRSWQPIQEELTFIPYFARANRESAGRLRTSLLRAE